MPLSQSTKFDEAATPRFAGSKHLLPNTGWGSVILPMHGEGGKAAKPIFGAYPPTGMDMNTELSEMQEAFANPNREPADIEAALHRRRFLPGDILRALAALSLIPGQRLDAAMVHSGLPKAGSS